MKVYNCMLSKIVHNIKNDIFDKKDNMIGNIGMWYICIILFCFFLFCWLKKMNLCPWNTRSNDMYISDKIYFSSHQYICVLHINKSKLLLSVTQKSINILYVFPDNQGILSQKINQNF